MAKKKFLRPTNEFTVRWVMWDLENVKRHTDAGFDDIPQDAVVDQFWVLIEFLQVNHLTVTTVVHSRDEMTSDTKLMNSDITDDGYYFLQKYSGRYIGRLHNRDSVEKSRAYLSKWFQDYKNTKGLNAD